MEKKFVLIMCLIFALVNTLMLAFTCQNVQADDSWVWVRNTVSGAWGEAVVGTGDAIYVARKNDFYCYNPTYNTWTALADPPNPASGDAFKTGTALAWDFDDHIYALYGAATADSRRWFYRYSITTNSWEALANSTAEQGEGDAITWVSTDNCVYATIGGEQRPTYFMRYNPSSNSWSDAPVDPPEGMGDGASLVWTDDDFLYALRGEYDEVSPLCDFWRYSLTGNAWTSMADIPANTHSGGVGGVGDGGSLLYVGHWLPNHTDYIYALSGNQASPENPAIPDNQTYRYTISTNSWEHIADLPFGVGHYVGCRLGYADGHIYAWQGTPSTWEGDGDDLAYYVFPALGSQYTLEISCTIGGTTDPAPGTYTYSAGSEVIVTATLGESFYFDHWEIDDVNVGSQNPVTVTMDANHTLRAAFSFLTYDLTISATVGGTTDPTPGTYPCINGTEVSVTAVPDTNHVFDYWKLDGDNIGSDNPVEILMRANHTLLAVFTLRNYTLTITSTLGGITDPPTGTHEFSAGASVNVTAISDSGYSFDYWLLDGGTRAENPITVLMDTNHTLEAFFIDDIPPGIGIPVQEPPDNIPEHQTVTVTVNVTDSGTGVHNVTLWYNVNNGTTWIPLNMTDISANVYQTSIPGYENGTWITYKMIAYDNNGNKKIKDNYGYHYIYQVIPEYPQLLILLLFIATTLLATLVFTKKHAHLNII